MEGFLGGLIGAAFGAWATLTVQRRADASQNRRDAAGLVGRLRVLAGEFLPAKWMQSPDWDLNPVMDELRALEGDWREMRPQLLSLMVPFPRETDLIERIHGGMRSLSIGVWLFARHSHEGFDVDRELADLERRHTELESAINDLTRRLAGDRKRRRPDR